MSGYNNGKRGSRYYEDDDQIQEETRKSIQMTIYHLGDKHPNLEPEEDLASCLRMIHEEKKSYDYEIVASISACVLELPHKLDHYCKLMVRLNGDDQIIVGKIINDFCDLLSKAVILGNWRHLVHGIRVIIEFERNGIVRSDSLKDLIFIILEKIELSSDNRVKAFLSWCLLANIYHLDEPKPIFDNITTLIPSEGLPCDLALLVELNRAFIESGQFKSASEATEDVDRTKAHQLTPIDFEGINVDPSWDPTFKTMSIFSDTFEPSNGPSDKLEQWSLFLCLRQVFENLEMNHAKCAETLLNVPNEKLAHPEKVVADFLFGELLRVDRRNGIRQVFCEVVLMDACRITKLFPPIMARALLALVKDIERLDACEQEALATWFAHHLANFDFKWKWDEWKETVELPRTNPKRIFVCSILEKVIRLSYHERISECIPEWLKPLLPPIPEPSLKHLDAEGEAGYNKILMAIQERSSVEAIQELVNPSNRIQFISALLMAGSKTFSHAVILIERYLPILQSLHPKGDQLAKIETISCIASFWSASTLHVEFLLERLTHYRILSALSIITWCLQTSEALLADVTTPFDQITDVLQWNIVSTAIKQSHAFPAIFKARLDESTEDEQKMKLQATLNGLQAEWQETYAFALEGLQKLPSLVIADEDTSQQVQLICSSFRNHLAASYN